MAKQIKKQSKNKASKVQKEWKWNKKYGIGIGIICALAVGAVVFSKVLFSIQVGQTEISLDALCSSGAVVYDANGQKYMTIDIKNSAGWVDLEQIPDNFRNLEMEDGISGTYSELIVKQFQGDADDHDVLTAALEQQHTKEEIEEFFWNTVYLGDGVYGIANGAKRFCGCELENASEGQLGLLKAQIVSYLSTGKYGNTKMEVYNASMIYEESGYVDAVVKETAKKLMDAGMDELSAYNKVFFENIRIDTYLDADIQAVVDEAYADKFVFTKMKDEYDYIQSAMVIMDKDGKVKALASGNDGDKVLNRAYSEKYQVGSTMKPVSTYSLGVENGHIHFSTLVENRQRLIQNAAGEKVFWPSNSDREYGGKVIATRALQESKNTVAVEIGGMVGEDTIYRFLEDKLGYDLVNYENQTTDRQLSALTLGYLTNGISLNKLTASYEMFANGGVFKDSALVQRVVSVDGQELFTDARENIQALSEETAYILNRMLYNNVNGAYGIAGKAAISGVEVLGKTGTVGNDEGKTASRLFVGITGDYIAGVWIGYDNEISLSLKSFYNPDEIYSNIMSRLPHSGTSFPMPEGVLAHAYCEFSGMLAGEYCQQTSMGYYTTDNQPEICSKCLDNN